MYYKHSFHSLVFMNWYKLSSLGFSEFNLVLCLICFLAKADVTWMESLLPGKWNSSNFKQLDGSKPFSMLEAMYGFLPILEISKFGKSADRTKSFQSNSMIIRGKMKILNLKLSYFKLTLNLSTWSVLQIISFKSMMFSWRNLFWKWICEFY